MYNIQTLNPQSLACIQKIRNEYSSNPQIVVVAMARAIASRLCMPAQEVDCASDFFIMSCGSEVKKLVSMMSDAMAFETQAVVDMTKTMWMVRYKSAYPMQVLYNVSDIVSESSFLGYSSVIPCADIKFIQDNSCVLVLAYNNFSKILCDFMSEDKVSQEALKNGKK